LNEHGNKVENGRPPDITAERIVRIKNVTELAASYIIRELKEVLSWKH